MKKAKQKVLKVFNFKFFSNQSIKTFEYFQKLVLVNNKSVFQVLMELIEDYVQHNQVSCTLVTESELLAHLDKIKCSITRHTLMNYRNQGLLGSTKYDRTWYTDGNNLVYDLE